MGYFWPLQSITLQSAAGSLSQHLAALSGVENGQMAPWELYSAAEYWVHVDWFSFLFFLLFYSIPYPCSALVSFIHVTLAVHTFASRGFATCRAHNNFFACTIYLDKELFLFKHPLTPEEREQRKDKSEIYLPGWTVSSWYLLKTTKLTLFKITHSWHSSSHVRAQWTTSSFVFAAFFFTSALRVWRCYRLFVTPSSFTDTCPHRRDVRRTHQPTPQQTQSCKAERRRHWLVWRTWQLHQPTSDQRGTGQWWITEEFEFNCFGTPLWQPQQPRRCDTSMKHNMCQFGNVFQSKGLSRNLKLLWIAFIATNMFSLRSFPNTQL